MKNIIIIQTVTEKNFPYYFIVLLFLFIMKAFDTYNFMIS